MEQPTLVQPAQIKHSRSLPGTWSMPVPAATEVPRCVEIRPVVTSAADGSQSSTSPTSLPPYPFRSDPGGSVLTSSAAVSPVSQSLATPSASSGLTSTISNRRPAVFSVMIPSATDGSSCDFGAAVASKDGGSLIVKSILGGRVSKYNADHPHLQIKRGDHIIKVNGLVGSAGALLEECQKEGSLELLIQSRVHHHRNHGSSTSSAPHVHKQASLQSNSAGSMLLGRVAELAAIDSIASQITEQSIDKDGSKVASLQDRNQSTRPGGYLDAGAGIGHLEVTEEEPSMTHTATSDGGGIRLGPYDSIQEVSATGALPRLPALPHGKSTATCVTAVHLQNLHSVASKSKQPGFCKQFYILLQRSSIQWWRGNWHRGIFLAVISGSSMVLAIMDTFVQQEAEWQVLPILNLHTTLALLSAVFCLNVFGSDRPVFWRERESGLSVAAFYLSKSLANTMDLLLQTFLLAAIYYLIRQPKVVFSIFFPPFLLVSFAAAGLGYTVSAFFPPKHGPFVTAIVIFVACGLLGHPLRIETMADGAMLEFFMDVLSITRWSVGFYFTNYLAHADLAVFASDEEATKAISGIEKIYIAPSLVEDHLLGIRSEIVFLVGMAIVWHLVGYVRLSYSNFNRHRRASKWTQRSHLALRYLENLLLQVIGEERQVQVRQLLLQIRMRLNACLP
eukprot:TRINITY_DN16919_c1_g1_i1.p1 TRINITY_DN16919_c1_g1~~TRINITY_DN16919_c1_g1_i1.p1  ORF type:complete len:736 (-),score=97.34 TRINITY_DN16919_c1_g1_i1:115-2142(-)